MKWVFGEIAGYFAFIDFKKNQKIGLQQVGTMYITCALLRNAIHACVVLQPVYTLTY